MSNTETATATTAWFVRNFDRKVKNEFMGLCRMQGKQWRTVLENMLRDHNHEAKKEIDGGK